MIENLKRHMQTAEHHVESRYEIVDGKPQMIADHIPTAEVTPHSNTFLKFGAQYLKRTQEPDTSSIRTVYIPRTHGIDDGYDHENAQSERDEAEGYRRKIISTTVMPTEQGSKNGLRNMG